jgi:TonB family protein
MKRGSRIAIGCLMLWVGTALATQEAAPQSKAESTPQHAPAQGVPQAVVVRKVLPAYPQLALQAHIQGKVVLRVTISREGDVSKVELVSGHPMLAAAASGAVKMWKYQPYLLNGQPAERETEAVLDFNLDGSEGRVLDAGTAAAPPAATGVVGEVPGGSAGQTGGFLFGTISSTPAAIPKVATPQRIRVSQGVSAGLLVKKVNPKYPPDALKGRIQGTVVMRALMSKAGDIEKLDVVSGHDMLVPAAMEAVQQWKYKPYLLNGQAVEVDTEIVVNFTLSGN